MSEKGGISDERFEALLYTAWILVIVIVGSIADQGNDVKAPVFPIVVAWALVYACIRALLHINGVWRWPW